MPDIEKDEAKEPVAAANQQKPPASQQKSAEFGGPKGPEPTRYGDWEIAGKCVDF